MLGLHADQQQLDISTLASQPVTDTLQIVDNIGLGHSSTADLQPAPLDDSGSVLSPQPSTSASSDSMQSSEDVTTENVAQLTSVECTSHVLTTNTKLAVFAVMASTEPPPKSSTCWLHVCQLV